MKRLKNAEQLHFNLDSTIGGADDYSPMKRPKKAEQLQLILDSTLEEIADYFHCSFEQQY